MIGLDTLGLLLNQLKYIFQKVLLHSLWKFGMKHFHVSLHEVVSNTYKTLLWIDLPLKVCDSGWHTIIKLKWNKYHRKPKETCKTMYNQHIIKNLVQFSMMVVTYRVLHGMGPSYLRDYLSLITFSWPIQSCSGKREHRIWKEP